MSVKMRADRRYYHKPAGIEYEQGAEFTVATELEADRLERVRKASRVAVDKKAVAWKAAAPVVETKVMKAEEPEKVDTHTAAAQRRYTRRDLKAED